MLRLGIRNKRFRGFLSIVAISCIAGIPYPYAHGANLLEVGNITAGPGQTGVIVPIYLNVDQDLTRLTFELGFTGAPFVATNYRKAGRTVQEPDPGGIMDHNILISVFAFGSVVIPAGSGQILEVEFDIDAGALQDVYPLVVSNLQAKHGFVDVSVPSQNGSITVGCTLGDSIACNTGLPGVCAPGTSTCQAGGIWGPCQQNVMPSTEICNDGLDNDCDARPIQRIRTAHRVMTLTMTATAALPAPPAHTLRPTVITQMRISTQVLRRYVMN